MKNTTKLNTQFKEACTLQQWDEMKKLILKGADPYFDNHYAISTCIAAKNLEMLVFILKNYPSSSFIPHAIFFGVIHTNDYDMVSYFVKELSVDVLDGRALTIACTFGYENIVNLLLDNDADLNFQNGSPLIFSLKHEHFNIAKTLILYGADIQFALDYPHLSTELKELAISYSQLKNIHNTLEKDLHSQSLPNTKTKI